MNRKFRSLRRQIETRNPKVSFKIFSEGEKTEYDYFMAMRRHYSAVLIDIEIIRGAGVPLTLARKASAAQRQIRSSKKGSLLNRDEVWVAFDRDEHPNVQSAIDQCRANGVGVAYSNPCFELWLILHFEDFDKPDHRHDVQQKLSGICKDYDRHSRKTTDCSKLMALLHDAELRADEQLRRRRQEGEPPGPPFTTVYELTRRITQAATNGEATA
jgi:hypothetical protein